MNHARTLRTSIFILCCISLFLNVSRVESKKSEKKISSCLTFACRDGCGADT